jgi:hypothetical protein
MEYAVLRACERFRIDPDTFDDLPRKKRAMFIAYNQVREYEEQELAYGPIRQLAKAMAGKK